MNIKEKLSEYIAAKKHFNTETSIVLACLAPFVREQDKLDFFNIDSREDRVDIKFYGDKEVSVTYTY